MKKNTKIFTSIFIIILIFFGVFLILQNKVDIVGSDRDVHGCITSAGYSWCEANASCIRSWENFCTSATPKTLTFICDSGKSITSTFYPTDDKFVDLKLSDGRNISVPRALSASGARYANPDESFVFWNKGDTAFVTEGSTKTETYSQCVLSTTAETGTRINLYFYNPDQDLGPGGAQCSKKGLVAVERVLPKTVTPLKESIEFLLRGELSAKERAQGITTEFPLPGVSLKSAVLVEGVATLTFNDPQNKTSGGSCRVAILWSQIEATAKQFPTVKSVRFMPEELFQP